MAEGYEAEPHEIDAVWEALEAEPHEIDAVWEALIGERDIDDTMEWWTHLSARLALLAEVERRVHDERARIAETWHRVHGDSFAVIASRVGLTRARAQQLVERGRRLDGAATDVTPPQR